MNIRITDIFSKRWSVDPLDIDRVEIRPHARVIYLCNGHSIVISMHEYRYLVPKIKGKEIQSCQ